MELARAEGVGGAGKAGSKFYQLLTYRFQGVLGSLCQDCEELLRVAPHQFGLLQPTGLGGQGLGIFRRFEV